jgi:hypothetical protein
MIHVLAALLFMTCAATAQVGGLAPLTRQPVLTVTEQIQLTGFTVVIIAGQKYSSACQYQIIFQTGPNAGTDVTMNGGNDDSGLVSAEIGTCNAPDCGTVLLSIVSCS